MSDGIEVDFARFISRLAIEYPVSEHASPFRERKAEPGEDLAKMGLQPELPFNVPRGP
jgi:hypothetical protein